MYTVRLNHYTTKIAIAQKRPDVIFRFFFTIIHHLHQQYKQNKYTTVVVNVAYFLDHRVRPNTIYLVSLSHPHILT